MTFGVSNHANLFSSPKTDKKLAPNYPAAYLSNRGAVQINNTFTLKFKRKYNY